MKAEDDLFGSENDGGSSVDEPEHICEMAASVKADDCDRSDGASWDESDIDAWSDADGLDILDDQEAFFDDEQPNHTGYHVRLTGFLS
ncbi:hypothetical protein GJ744_004927 [Endocarpon pusillum]|uniref:Uncharacterized protein n=1 Tax=Endocarpon pusillum TaxID=364733 RepID=A0A8H7E6Q9_9EURO|nr:hypothetical protein GJ744_004927 [Endocarpon pusillum]